MAMFRNVLRSSKLCNTIQEQCLPRLENPFVILSIRHYKHYNPKFKWLRARKVIKLELPDFHEKTKDVEQMTRDEIRSKMKERGVLPPRHYTERPLYISSTGGAFEPYIPPEGDGKVSMITKAGAKQKYELLEKKGKSMMAIRKIKSYDDDFETDVFVQQAQDIYINAHTALMSKDQEKLTDYVTERANPEMMNNIKNKTLRWKFIGSIEPPKVVHARCTDVVSKENIFGQVTVRFHTQQMLAIYDRFGRLMYGSEILAKDVLEYIVFEKHIVNQYGRWRVHEKIIPDWLPLGEPSRRTYREVTEEDEEEEKSSEPQTESSQIVEKSGQSQAPLATA